MASKSDKVLDAVKASLKADNIPLSDKARCVESLSACCAAKLCVKVYLNFYQNNLIK